MVGLLFSAAAVVQVAEGIGEGGVVRAAVGHPSDEGLGVGQGLVLGLGVGPFLAELVYLMTYEILGIGAVEFPFQGADSVG